MIVAEEVSKYYGDRRALDRVSFEISRGEVVGFLGLNGAGKTTVLKILSGLLLPSAGRISIAGIDIAEDPLKVRHQVGFLPDQPPLYRDMTVRQYLRYAGRLNRLPASDIDRRIDEVAVHTQLGEVLDEMVAWLSQGYRQRLGIAQAIVHRPALVILDEPITGLDPSQIVGMRKVIRDLGEHHTVLLSSHILSEISHTCDRILVLHEGRIVARGSEVELSSHAASGPILITARGTPELALQAVNSVAGAHEPRVEAGPDGTVRLQIEADGYEVREKLVAALVAAGMGVRQITEAKTELESVFMQLTHPLAPATRAEQGGEA